jgi:carbohydrate kinase (thermoresistant glucokinase family)
MIIVLTGVCGAGKTTVGSLLAKDLQVPFFEGDDYHSQDAIRKMADSLPLTDRDRQPWLAALQKLIRAHSRQGKTMVMACSALKKSYRDLLSSGSKEVHFVHLRGGYDLISTRLQQRQDHFAKVDLLASQFSILEQSPECLQVDVSARPAEIVRLIKRQLHLESKFELPAGTETD